MSKMGEYLINEMERKFGDVMVAPSSLCSDCGQPYQEHNGCNCLEVEDDEPKS